MLSAGCWKFDPDHCVSKGGDIGCDKGFFCSQCEPRENGCLPELPSENCYYPEHPTESTTGSTTNPTSPTETGLPTPDPSLDDTGSTTGSTGDPGCVSDDDCPDPAATFCAADGECIGCDMLPDPSAGCVGLGMLTPLCDRGLCVGCDEAPEFCSGQTPICSPETGCRACVEHFECPDSACHLDGDDVGACFDPSEVMLVGSANELEGIVGALEGTDRAVLVLEPGFYPVTIDFGDSTEVAVLGSIVSPPILTGDGARVVEVFGDAIVYLSNIEVANSNIAGDGLDCTGRSAWVDDSRLDGNRIGIVSAGCSVHARRATIVQNTDRGIECSGGELSLINSAVGLNGNGFTPDVGGLHLTNVTVDFVYSSIVANQSSIPVEASIACAGGEMGVVSNSIILAGGGGLGGCDGLSLVYNAVDNPIIGRPNVDVGAAMGSWFMGLGTGDFHLSAAGEGMFADIAQWQEGDPVADVDGDPIPTDTPSFPGYDQP